jgi:hypothetical protein
MLGSFSAVTTTLTSADRKNFGGKAVHYGLLRRTIPNNSEPAIAFSFDLWEGFMDQSIPGEGSLRQAISQRLLGFTNFPPDLNALRIQLAAIRGMITGTATFSPALRSVVTNALIPNAAWDHILPGNHVLQAAQTCVVHIASTLVRNAIGEQCLGVTLVHNSVWGQ